MTILDLLILTAFTVGVLMMAAVTPQNYRLGVYIALAVGWSVVLVYLAAPEGMFNRPLHHWMR